MEDSYYGEWAQGGMNLTALWGRIRNRNVLGKALFLCGLIGVWASNVGIDGALPHRIVLSLLGWCLVVVSGRYRKSGNIQGLQTLPAQAKAVGV
jgi:hypothetical protein